MLLSVQEKPDMPTPGLNPNFLSKDASSKVAFNPKVAPVILTEGSLEVKLPTIWTGEKQRIR